MFETGLKPWTTSLQQPQLARMSWPGWIRECIPWCFWKHRRKGFADLCCLYKKDIITKCFLPGFWIWRASPKDNLGNLQGTLGTGDYVWIFWCHHWLEVSSTTPWNSCWSTCATCAWRQLCSSGGQRGLVVKAQRTPSKMNFRDVVFRCVPDKAG